MQLEMRDRKGRNITEERVYLHWDTFSVVHLQAFPIPLYDIRKEGRKEGRKRNQIVNATPNRNNKNSEHDVVREARPIP